MLVLLTRTGWLLKTLNDVDALLWHSLKVQQGLLVDFGSFPQKFMDLLNMCLQEEHADCPKWVPLCGEPHMWCFSVFLLCLSVRSHCCWGGLKSKMLSLHYLFQCFQIFLENLSLFKNIFFIPIALICNCVCVRCVCAHTSVCVRVEFWMHLKNVRALRACAG